MAFVYSCCFWFSLRLGGILIGIISLIRGSLVLAILCVAQSRVQEVKDKIDQWMNNMNLIFTRDYFENIRADPEKYITFLIGVACLYIFLCTLYIYGAYRCNNALMIGFILMELVRIITISAIIIIWLLALKQNTMDIGLLIGVSVASGFFLLGIFYLWVCAASLPVLINEMERDEHRTTIAKLQSMLEANPKLHRQELDGSLIRDTTTLNSYRQDIYSTKHGRNIENTFAVGSRISVPYYIR